MNRKSSLLVLCGGFRRVTIYAKDARCRNRGSSYEGNGRRFEQHIPSAGNCKRRGGFRPFRWHCPAVSVLSFAPPALGLLILLPTHGLRGTPWAKLFRPFGTGTRDGWPQPSLI